MAQPWTNLIPCLVGAGKIDEAKAAFEAAREIVPEALNRMLAGIVPRARPRDRERSRVFMRIAAGLEDPSAAEAVR